MKSFLVLAALALFSVPAMVLSAIPSEVVNPVSVTVLLGNPATFTSSAKDDLTIQWQKSTDKGLSFSDISGATNETYVTSATTLADHESQYRAAFTNADGTVYSSGAILTLQGPIFNTQPAAVTVQSGSTATFSASISNATSYVWQTRLNSGANWGNTGSSGTLSLSSTATTVTHSFTAFTGDNGKQFRLVIANSVSTATSTIVSSNNVTLTVTSPTDPTPVDPEPTPTPGVNTNGVLVYEVSFKHKEGFNVDFWDEGYIIVPAVGGEGSALFTATDNGIRTFRSFSGSVSFFNAKDKHHSYSVMAMAGTSPSIVCIQAYGKADDKVKANGPTYSITVRAAESLEGLAQASRDESTLAVSEQPRDGTLGFLEFAEVKVHIDQRLTDQANENASSVASMFDYLKKVLTRRGYVEEAITADDDTTDDSTDTTDDTTDDTTTTTTSN